MTGPLYIVPPAAWAAALGLALLIGCSRPVDRPIEGALPRPGDASTGWGVDVPPTIAVPTASAVVPTPIVVATASPSPTPLGRNPILSGLLPAPNALIAAGPVNIGARISGSTDIETATLTVDGAIVQPQITRPDPRTWLVAYIGQLDTGRHEVRLSARDRSGRAGGYTWQFEVQPRSRTTPAARPAPTARP